MHLLSDLLATLPDGRVLDICIGLHWTAVAVDVEGEQRCGLASTLSAGHSRHRHGPDVPQAGYLLDLSGRELAEMCLLEAPTQASVGVAALNALLDHHPQCWREANAEQVIAENGKGRRVVLIGHFPFIDHLRTRVGELIVLEQEPGPDDLPAHAAPMVLPEAQVVAITGMTLVNHTFEKLLSLCLPDAYVIVLGPSTPLSPVLFEYGIDVISGSVVTDVAPVMRAVAQGGNFRQVHRAGVRLVNMFKDSWTG